MSTVDVATVEHARQHHGRPLSSHPGRLRACLYLRTGHKVEVSERARWERVGTEYVARKGYDLGVMIIDPDGNRWPEVFSLLGTRQVDVVVVGRHDFIPLHVVPRIEVIADEQSRPRVIDGVPLTPDLRLRRARRTAEVVPADDPRRPRVLR